MKTPIIFVLVMLLLAILACSGATPQNVRVTDLPRYVCPSSTPRPTDTPQPTRTQQATSTPPSITTPMSYATYAPSCNYALPASYRYACPPDPCMVIIGCGSYWLNPLATADPPGFWSGGGVGVGSTSTPRPTFTPPATTTPYPTPTPYVVTENYEMGSDVFIDGDLRLRFRIENPQIVPLNERQQVVTWQIQVENRGDLPYSTLPGAQVFVSSLLVDEVEQEGIWYASAEAARQANITLDSDALDVVTLERRDRLSLTLASLTPIGDVHKIGWVLDPYSGGIGSGLVGGNTAIWVNERNPEICSGNPDEEVILPTVSSTPPTATPSVTPYIPPYAGATP